MKYNMYQNTLYLGGGRELKMELQPPDIHGVRDSIIYWDDGTLGPDERAKGYQHYIKWLASVENTAIIGP